MTTKVTRIDREYQERERKRERVEVTTKRPSLDCHCNQESTGVRENNNNRRNDH